MAWLVALALASPLAFAEKADKFKPLVGDADAARFDNLKQTNVLTGNVVITKGTMILRGSQVLLRKDPEGYEFGTATATAGQKAFFRQKRDAPDEWIEGESETIVYDGKADTITFSKNAVLRRYRGSSVSDEAAGSVITYDNTTDVFNVAGGATNATPSNPTGRVRIMLSPKDNGAAKPVPAPAATLRPTTNLGDTNK